MSAFKYRFKRENVSKLSKDTSLKLAILCQDLSNHIRSCFQPIQDDLTSPGKTSALSDQTIDEGQTLPMVTDAETATYSSLPAVSNQIVLKVLTSMDSNLNRIGNKHGLQIAEKLTLPPKQPKLTHDDLGWETHEAEKLAQEKLVQEKLALLAVHEEKLAQEKLAAFQEKLAQEKLAQEKLVQEKLAQENLALQEELAQEKLVQEKLAQEKLAQEKLAFQVKLVGKGKLDCVVKKLSQTYEKPNHTPQIGLTFKCSSEEKTFYKDIKSLLKSTGLKNEKNLFDFMSFTALDYIYIVEPRDVTTLHQKTLFAG